MPEEEELTPEEKLLKVIQKGDTATHSAASVVSGGATIGDEKDASPVSKSGASGESPFGLTTINKILVVAILIAIGLSAYEIYANIPKKDLVFEPSDLNLSGEANVAEVASLGDTLDMFDDVRITGIPPTEFHREKGEGDKPRQGWRAYARDNLNVLGTSTVMVKMADGGKESVLEAIVMDTKAKKMHFLRVGKDIKIIDKDIRVDEINEKTVDLAWEEEHQIIGDTGSR